MSICSVKFASCAALLMGIALSLNPIKVQAACTVTSEAGVRKPYTLLTLPDININPSRDIGDTLAEIRGRIARNNKSEINCSDGVRLRAYAAELHTGSSLPDGIAMEVEFGDPAGNPSANGTVPNMVNATGTYGIWNSYDYATVTIRLKKTGIIRGNTGSITSITKHHAVSDNGQEYMLAETVFDNAVNIEVDQPECSVEHSSDTVQLGAASGSAAVGPISNWVYFNIKVACQNVSDNQQPSVYVRVLDNGSQPIAGPDGILSLVNTEGDSASGVGVQLAAGAEAELGIEIGSYWGAGQVDIVSGNLDIPLWARIFQTETMVKAGEVKAIATVEVEFN